ncbi:MAG: hypothetical protein WC205_09850 [Opitutaceae bacterium]|jgi:hypothetical protein
MSLAEVIQEIVRMTPAERQEVEGQLRLLRWKETPGLAERLAATNARMDAGLKVTSVELEAMLRAKEAAENPSKG